MTVHERDENGKKAAGATYRPAAPGSAVLPRTGKGKYLHLTGPLENFQVTSCVHLPALSRSLPAWLQLKTSCACEWVSLVFNHARSVGVASTKPTFLTQHFNTSQNNTLSTTFLLNPNTF
jgi:hypothetical protein